MLLDTRTLSFANMAGAAIFALVMLFIWRTRKTYPGFGLWALGNAAAAAGFLLLSLLNQISDVFSILLAYMLLFTQNILLFEGIQRFQGNFRISKINLFLAGVLFIILVYSTFVGNNSEIRLITVSLFSGWMYLRCAVTFFTPSRNKFLVNWFIQILLLSFFLLMMARAIFVYVDPNIKIIFDPDNFHGFVFLLILLFNFSLTFGFVVLNSERLENELIETQVSIQHMAETDYLTGIFNNRHFFSVCHMEILRAHRHQYEIAVILFDIDNFKHINDTFGHPEGDKVLISVVKACQKCLREIDTFSRLGGDEFSILLPETDLEGALNAAERLRETIESTFIQFEATSIHVTASFGVSLIRPYEEIIDPALKRADTALYEAKKHQRNRVVAVPVDTNDSFIPSLPRTPLKKRGTGIIPRDRQMVTRPQAGKWR